MIIHGDSMEVLKTLPDQSINTCVTSPPYFNLRDYKIEGQIGIEQTPDEYVAKLVAVFREVRRLLKDDGTLWLNLGDSYFSDTKGTGGPSAKQLSNAGSSYNVRKFERTNGLKPKDLIGIPWRVAFALQADGWYLRQDIIWHKPNPMPESVKDRCTKAHEYIFLLSKSERYYYDHDAVKEHQAASSIERSKYGWNGRTNDGSNGARTGSGFKKMSGSNLTMGEGGFIPSDGMRNRRSVWSIPTKPFKGAHFAVMPEALVEPCILAGCPEGGTVLDPFAGAGTVGVVANRYGRSFIGVELNKDYIEIANKRINSELQKREVA